MALDTKSNLPEQVNFVQHNQRATQASHGVLLVPEHLT